MRAAIFLGLAACAVPAKHAPEEADAAVAAADASGLDAQPCSPIVAGSGARGLFHFDETSGQVLDNAVDDDDAVLGDDASAEGDDPARMSLARFDGGLRFSAAETDRVIWPSGVGDLGDHFVELWVRPGSGGGALFTTYSGTISLSLAADPLRVVYRLADRGGDSDDVAALTSTPITAGDWHHVLAAYKKPTLRLWIDGVPMPTVALDAGFRAETITIGMGLDGELDELYFAQAPLEDDDVAMARYCAP